MPTYDRPVSRKLKINRKSSPKVDTDNSSKPVMISSESGNDTENLFPKECEKIPGLTVPPVFESIENKSDSDFLNVGKIQFRFC